VPADTNNASVASAEHMRPGRALGGEHMAPALGAGHVHVWAIPLDAADPSDQSLSPAEVARARRFRFAIDRNRFVESHAATRAILGAYLDIEPRDIAIQADAVGKPRLDPKRHPRAPSFNLSHSRDLAVLALSHSAIGVDLEFERSLPDPDGVVRRFFSREESAAYFALPHALRPCAFAAAWTLKEAYLKACGEGLRRRLDSFSVTMRPDLPPRLLAVPGRPREVKRWRLLRFQLRLGYVGAVAVAGRTTRLREWSWNGALQ
jgi:4'-phosphopantetheinyl transferase